MQQDSPLVIRYKTIRREFDLVGIELSYDTTGILLAAQIIEESINAATIRLVTAINEVSLRG